MKHILLTLVLAFVGLVTRAENIYYGYAPVNVDERDMALTGTNSNNFMTVAVRLTPEQDPVWRSLQGSKVVGVRVYLRSEYKQKKKEWSCVSIYEGSLKATPQETYVDFKAGWNEVLFDEPVTIGSEDLYVGAQVFETLGTPMPFAAFSKAATNCGFYTRSSYDDWQDFSARGAVLLQAIVEPAAGVSVERAAYVSYANAPLTVGPDQPFNCSIYIHNQSAEPLTTFSFESSDGVKSYTYDLDFTDNPIEAFGGRSISYNIYGPSTIGTAVNLSVKATKFNGKTAAEAFPFTGQLYVMKDAFIRIPLVEEFTSQNCVNCPFMAYFLDQAMENHNGPLLYVTHHAGFANDRFTKKVDEELLYLFKNDNGTFNPAVMYDRRVEKGSVSPIVTAKIAETQPYDDALNAAASFPAMAQVYVDTVYVDGKLQVTVHGAVNRSYYEEDIPVYLSCYLCESGIPVSAAFPQLGLDEPGAPADLQEKFHHNGIKRIVFNKENLGDRLIITPTVDDTYEFSVTYDPATVEDKWLMENCDVIAFVHLIDKDDMNYNYVLNAGSVRMNDYLANPNAIHSVRLDAPAAGLYDLSGRRLTTEASRRGFYISNGRKVIR